MLLPKPSKKAGRWTLLFIGDHGETIKVGRVKGLALTSAFLLVVAVTVAASFYIFYKSTMEDNKRLRNALELSKQQVISSRHEKDILMARIVVAESRIETILVRTQKKPIEKHPDKSPVKSSSVETEPNAADVEKKPASSSPVQSKKSLIVAIKDFIVFNEPDSNTLRVRFIIKKIDPNSKYVSGYAFVILKDNEVDQDKWLILPSVTLVSGKPSQINRGQYFSITRFKPIKLKKENQADPNRFKNATIFIYSKKGKLLLEKNFPVAIKGYD